MGIVSSFKKRLPIVGGGTGRASTTDSAAPSASPAPTDPAAPAQSDPRGGKEPAAFIEEFVKSNPIAIFMKGSPTQPMCGFSANAAAILTSYGHDVAHFDVFSDPEIRQGIKDFSNWPTLPQIYVGGEFLGGSDILAQMHASEELKALFEEAVSDA